MSNRFRLASLVLMPLAIAGPASAADEEARPTREAVCRRAEAPPKLDGKLDDACWKAAAPITDFAAFWDKAPRSGTRAMLVWDDEAIYYGAELTDAELRAFGTKRNDHLWEGDVFEMFLKPSKDRPEYYEFQSNPRAVVFEAAFPKRGGITRPFNQEPVLGHEAAVTLDGTLDKPGDADRKWTVEGRIPWTAFAPSGGAPKPGAKWSFALCRYDYGPEGTEPLLMSSAPLTQPNFHRYEDYGTLTFEGPRNGR
jgi:hypothetical protein